MLIMSPVITSVIEAAGWRTGYLVLAGVSAVLILPASIRSSATSSGQGHAALWLRRGRDGHRDRGDDRDSTRGVSYARAIKSPAFFFCIGFLCLVQLTCCMNQLFPTYASEVGFSPMVGGFTVSAASLFDLFLNPIVGTTCDRFGSTKAILGWLAVSILSFVMLMMSSGNSTLSILAAGVNDVMYVIAGTA
ncbi:MAG: MFS transporter [Collinsella sp.]